MSIDHLLIDPPKSAGDRIWNNAIREAYDKGYRDGYNAHATAALEWKATHGAYPKHGKGENP